MGAAIVSALRDIAVDQRKRRYQRRAPRTTRIGECWPSRWTTTPVGPLVIHMKANLNRQATLPSHQDNGSSPEGENQQRDWNAPTKPAMRMHQLPQANEAFRADSPAANDATGEEPRLTLIPIDQVMKRTSIGRTTIYQLIRQGKFP